MHRFFSCVRTGVALLTPVVVAACTPALNWRVTTTPDGTLSAMFPCRPETSERPIRLAGREASMRLLACTADGVTFALAEVNVSDGSLADEAMAELLARSTSNIDGQESASSAWAVPRTNTRSATRRTITGHWPDGSAALEYRASLIAQARLYRLSVIGKAPPPEAVDSFFAGFAPVTH